jgi:hypothetical protein
MRMLDDCGSYMTYVGEQRPRRPSSRDYANRGVADRCKFYPIALTKPVIAAPSPSAERSFSSWRSGQENIIASLLARKYAQTQRPQHPNREIEDHHGNDDQAT